MEGTKTIHTLVLDTGAIIKNEPSVSTLLSQSESLVTVPEIISEIKDAATRSRVQTTLSPFLNLRSPSPASVKFVVDFARRTGDLAVLSKPDIQIIALTYEIECERNGGDWRLRNAPGQKRVNGAPPSKVVPEGEAVATAVDGDDSTDVPSSQSTQQISVDEENSSGAGPAAEIPSSRSDQPSANVERTESNQTDPPSQVEQLKAGGNPLQSDQSTGTESSVDASQPAVVTQPAEEDATAANEEAPQVIESSEAHSIDDEISSQLADTKLEEDPKHAEIDTLPKVDSAQNSAESQEDCSDSEGWITPSNLKKKQAQDAGASTTPADEPKTMQVAVLTTDFAMQNVILQINLNLLSPSLTRVKHLKTFVLRCHACFQISKDMNKQFCPRCGQPTLTRVSCSTSANGEFKLHLKKNMQWNHRGEKYSVPKPVHGSANGKLKGGGKGGWGNSLMLAEDQKEYQRATANEKRTKERSLMDEDYLPGILTGDRSRGGGRVKVGAGRNVNSKKR